MHHHRKLLVVIVAAVAVAGAITFFHRSVEPRYQGRSLSEWLMIYYESDRANADRAQRPVAAAAVRAIGTNALPCLLGWIRFETPSWHRGLARVMPIRIGNSRPARATVYRGFHQAEAARLGFRLLGTNALDAIPALSLMMQDAAHPETASRAIEVLSRLGPPAFELMTGSLADTNQPFRESIALLMGLNTASFVGTNVCLPPLRAALNDPSPKVRTAASNMLARLTTGPGASAPGQPLLLLPE